MITKTNLFDSILGTESQQAIDAQCQLHANRVGLILKILYGRQLDDLRSDFVDKLTMLVQSTADSIDDVLSATKED